MVSAKKRGEVQAAKGMKISMFAIAGIIAVAGLIAYSNTFSVPFQWDDVYQVRANEDLHEITNYAELSEWTQVNQRPLSKFTLAMNWYVGGEDVAGYHLINLLFHIITTLLVYLLVSFSISLLTADERFDRRMRQPIALFAALLFLLHPLQTMAVTYIVQRMTVMAAMFYVLSLLLYARGRMVYLDGEHRKRSVFLILMAVVSGILGVLSKQNAATFPAAFLLYELYFIRKADGNVCRKYLIAGTSVIGLLLLAALFGGYLPAETDKFTRIEYFIAQLGVAHKYILLLIAPVRQAADYFIVRGDQLIGVYEVIGMLLVTGLIFLGVYTFKRNKLLSFGIFFFFLSASIESGLIPIRDIMMEHRMYLPMLGFTFVLSGLLIRYFPYKRLTVLFLFGGLILVILTIATFNRNKVWQSEISLWADNLEKNPRSSRAMNNLGYAIKENALKLKDQAVKVRELNKAISYFTLAMDGDTIFTDAYLNRGLTYIELGKYNKALEDINYISKKRPKKRYLKFYLEGVAYARKGEMEPALKSLNIAIDLNTDFYLLYTWRGLVYEAMKDPGNALADFKRSFEMEPSQTILMINISNAHYALEQFEEALFWAKKARGAGELVDPQYIKQLEQLSGS